MLTAVEQDHISNLANVMKSLRDNYLTMKQLNAQWAGSTNFDTLITQEDIDSLPSLSEHSITTDDLTECNYIVGILIGLVDARIDQLLRLASL